MFHKGEIKVQQLAGEQEYANQLIRMIKDSVNPSAIRFIESQQVLMVASSNESDEMWCSVLVGDQGLVTVKDPQTIGIQKSKLRSTSNDPFYTHILRQPQVGILFFEPLSRRRYRINGHITEEGTEFVISIQEAYPNCPKYIQKSQLDFAEPQREIDSSTSSGTSLTDQIRQWIGGASAFFMATQSKDKKADASHRGGNPGFVTISDNNDLVIPDYPGNSLFNSLGNIYENPNVGLLFIDFDTGDTLQLTGKATLNFDMTNEEELEQTGGTGRFWTFRMDKWLIQSAAIPLRGDILEYSPFNL